MPWLDVSFGSSRTGLGTVGYRLYDATGGDAVARTTVGVVEIGGGAYGVDRASIPTTARGIEWDTGGASPIFAHEDFKLAEMHQDMGLDRNNAKTITEVTEGADYDEAVDTIAKDVTKVGAVTTIDRTA